jgi:tRNA(Ile)-lysidine synthase
MLVKVRSWIDKHKMLNDGEKIVVACSGGPDSLALLHILEGFRSEYNISIVAAHLDHMFRGEESAEEAEFVVAFCRKRGIICYQEAIDVPQIIKETGMSDEEAGRVVRYQYLRQIAETIGGAKIATGHHRDDQAETVLLHMLRGAGSTGLRGIQPVNADIIRPLLSVSRAEIMMYCEEHDLQPQFDSSNGKTKYLRNRIRLSLLPELEKQYNSSIKDALCRTATIVGDEHEFIQDTAKKLWFTVAEDYGDHIFINAKKMELIHIAVKREIFRMAIEKKQGCLTGISFYHVETLIEMLSSGRVGSIMQLPGGLTTSKSYEGLYIGKNSMIPLEIVDYSWQTLTVPGNTAIPKLGIQVVAKQRNSVARGQSNIAVFDEEDLVLPLFVRTRLEGDRFQPLGLGGSKKLKDFFIDAKVPRHMRDSVPIICDGRGIIWVGGYRQGEIGKVTDKTKKFLEMRIMENAIKSN